MALSLGMNNSFGREIEMTKNDARKAVLRIAQCTVQQSIWPDEPGRIEWADGGKLLRVLYDFVDTIYAHYNSDYAFGFVTRQAQYIADIYGESLNQEGA
jgi:hypothetical protein